MRCESTVSVLLCDGQLLCFVVDLFLPFIFFDEHDSHQSLCLCELKSSFCQHPMNVPVGQAPIAIVIRLAGICSILFVTRAPHRVGIFRLHLCL